MKSRITQTLLLGFVGLLALGITPELRAGEDKGCSNASVRGAYAFMGDGTIVGIGSVAFAGSFTSDGKGNLAGAETISFNGSIVREKFTATYAINADCTGSATAVIVGPVPRTAHFDFVVLDRGNEIFDVQTDPGTSVTFGTKKIFPGQGKQD